MDRHFKGDGPPIRRHIRGIVNLRAGQARQSTRQDRAREDSRRKLGWRGGFKLIAEVGEAHESRCDGGIQDGSVKLDTTGAAGGPANESLVGFSPEIPTTSDENRQEISSLLA